MSGTIFDRLQGVASGIAVKAPCRVATTANITLSGLQTIDGVTLVEDDRVLVKDQTDTTQNGVYKASSGAWTRATDFDGTTDIVQGTQVYVNLGTVGTNSTWRVTTTSPVPGSALAFSRLTPDLTGTAVTTSGLTQATSRMLGRTTAGTGAIQEITVGAGLTFSSGSLSANATGAITGSGLTQATAKMLGRSTAGTGAIEEITVGSGLSLSAGTLTATGSPSGSITTSGYTQTTARLLGRTTAATGAIEEITVGAGLTFSGGSLSSSASSSGITTIASGSLSGSAVTITSIPATYAYLVLQITGASSTNSGAIRVRVSTDNGSSYDSTSGNYIDNSTGATLLNDGSLNLGSGDSITSTTRLSGYQSGPHTEYRTRLYSTDTVNYPEAMIHGTYIGSTSAIDALQISCSAGTFDAGTYALYGIA
jgi:phage-related tail fiber protein